MPKIKLDIRSATLIVAASNSLHHNMANYVCDGTADQVEIQAAVDALPATGGVVYLLDGDYSVTDEINLRTNVSIIGVGFGSHITANGNWGCIIIPTTSSRNQIKNLWLSGEGSGLPLVSNVGIRIRGGKFIVLENLLFGNPGFGQQGITISTYSGVRPSDISIRGIITDTTNGVGSAEVCYAEFIKIDAADRVSINNCAIRGSEDQAIRLQSLALASENISITGNVFGDIQVFAAISGLNSSANKVVICGNVFENINGSGIEIRGSDWNVSGNIIDGTGFGGSVGVDIILATNCLIANNRIKDFVTGISCDGDDNIISANRISDCTTGINLAAAADTNSVVGNSIKGTVTTPIVDAGTNNTFLNNEPVAPIEEKRYVYVKNTSGGASAVGDVARHKAVAAGNEYDTPTANGEDSVLGMVAEVINNNAFGLVQISGKTTVLKSTNAGGNIVIGDYLCSENGVRARLAAAGDMAFARALEACAAADCTIDALINSPMKM